MTEVEICKEAIVTHFSQDKQLFGYSHYSYNVACVFVQTWLQNGLIFVLPHSGQRVMLSDGVS